MVTTPHPTRIIVIHGHHSTSNKNNSDSCSPLHIQQEFTVAHAHHSTSNKNYSDSGGIHSGKRTFEKEKLRRKRLSFPKV
jgi:hypothetical protein